MASNYLLETKNGSAASETNLSGTSTENMRNIVFLPDKYAVVICTDECHECFGKEIEVFEGNWKSHYLHVERIGEDNFNLSIDYGNLMFGLTYTQLDRIVKERTKNER